MFDLHSHTFYSDGELSPAELVQRAAANGLTHLAITDHDCTAALQDLQQISLPPNLQIISGVEISCIWERREVHIVGLFIDVNNPALQTLLLQQQALRLSRAEEFARRLEAIGIVGLLDYISMLPCQAIGRNHVADFLIAKGHAVDKTQAFKKYLGNQGRVQTPVVWSTLANALDCIKSAGGVAVIAHPDRYRFTRKKFLALIDDFKALGGEAMEVSYSNLSHEQLLKLSSICEEAELWASVGSDFHSPEAGWMDLGRIRQLPAACRGRAIWLHPRWPEAISA